MKTSTEKLPVTTKKQKFVGFDELYTRDGEAVPVQISQIEDRDFNFHKLWLQMFINGLDRIANKKMKLAFWIIDHLNKENQLVYTFRRMAEETGLSIDTIIRTMKELQNGDPPFLKKLQSGVYVVNPDILYKGSHKGRMGVIYQFGTIPTPKQAEKIAETQKEQEKAKEKTLSDAPESPKTHETPSAGENVPAEGEKTKFEPKITEMEKKVELPPLVASDSYGEHLLNNPSILNQRLNFFQQFNNQIPLIENPEFSEKMTELFQTENNVRFWSMADDKSLEELPKFHDEYVEWQARRDALQA